MRNASKQSNGHRFVLNGGGSGIRHHGEELDAPSHSGKYVVVVLGVEWTRAGSLREQGTGLIFEVGCLKVQVAGDCLLKLGL